MKVKSEGKYERSRKESGHFPALSVLSSFMPYRRLRETKMASLYDFGTRDEEFQAASSWLSSTPVAANLPNNLKLEVCS